jgi:2-hydroxychromene-2-carboxylate isomerase
MYDEASPLNREGWRSRGVWGIPTFQQIDR